MERTPTITDVFAPWTMAQQTFWERWRDAMMNGATPAHSPLNTWSSPIGLWRAAIYGSLDVQLVTAEAWKAWICNNDANIPEITLGTCQTLHFVEDWTRAQMQLWESWFAALESLASPTDTRITEPAPQAAKPRLHARPRPHSTRAPAQPHNGIPA